MKVVKGGLGLFCSSASDTLRIFLVSDTESRRQWQFARLATATGQLAKKGNLRAESRKYSFAVGSRQILQ